MTKIFISYRRNDASHAADRLHEAIKPFVENPAQDIFLDIDAIPPGVDFVDYLSEQVGQCDVLMAVIGEAWLDTKGELGRRVDDPLDFVRIEIAEALRRGIPVIPILLDSARMPRESELPDELKPLSRRNAVNLRRENFKSDVAKMMAGLNYVARTSRSRQTATATPAPFPKNHYMMTRDILIRVAAGRSLITYEELSSMIGAEHDALWGILQKTANENRRLNEPLLCALVIHATTWMPGDRYFLENHPGVVPGTRASKDLWKAEIERVYHYARDRPERLLVKPPGGPMDLVRRWLRDNI